MDTLSFISALSPPLSIVPSKKDNLAYIVDLD